MDFAIFHTIYRDMAIELPRPPTKVSASIAGDFSRPANLCSMPRGPARRGNAHLGDEQLPALFDHRYLPYDD